MGEKPAWKRQYFLLYAAGTMILLLGVCGCIEPEKRYQAKKSLDNLLETKGERKLSIARLLMSRGFFEEALEKNKEVLREYPESLGDRALLQIAVLYAHPSNPQADLQTSEDNLERLVKSYPDSDLKLEAETWVLVLKDINTLNASYHKQTSELKRKMDLLEARDNDKKTKLKDLKRAKKALQNRLNELTKNINQLQAQLDSLKNVDLGIEEKRRQTLKEGKSE